MIPFTESLRYSYPLTPDSWVLMLGGYQGKDAKILAENYGCKVVCYEPVRQFYQELVINLLGVNSKIAHLIYPVHAGVAADTRDEEFGVQGDRSGICNGSEQREKVRLISICDVVQNWTKEFNRTPDLCVMNIEGGEYECLEALLARGMDTFMAHLQVQPHSVVPGAVKRWAGIRNRLMINFRVASEDPQMDIGWLLVERK